MYAKYAKLRDEKQMTDNAVAVASGVAQSTIYDWKQRAAINPKASLSVENLLKISKALGVTVDYFAQDE